MGGPTRPQRVSARTERAPSASNDADHSRRTPQPVQTPPQQRRLVKLHAIASQTLTYPEPRKPRHSHRNLHHPRTARHRAITIPITRALVLIARLAVPGLLIGRAITSVATPSSPPAARARGLFVYRDPLSDRESPRPIHAAAARGRAVNAYHALEHQRERNHPDCPKGLDHHHGDYDHMLP